MSIRPTVFALTLVSLGALALPAASQPRPVPPAPTVTPADEAEHTRGLDLRRQHRDADARDVFRSIYERSHEPRALARQGSAEAAMGDWLPAEEHLSAALQSAADPWIVANRAGLEADVAGFRQHVGLLEVTSSAPHAEVWLDGARVATLPLTGALRLRAGTLSVEVRAEGFVSQQRTVTVQPGARLLTREMVNLTPAAAPRPAVAAATPGSVAAPPPVRPPTPAVADAPASWFNPLHVAGLSVAGAGILGVGVGIAGLVIQGGQQRTLDAEPCASDTALAMSRCVDALNSASSAGTLSIVGFAAGGALLVGGIVMMIIPGSTPARAARVSFTPGPGSVGLGARVTF